MDELPRQIGIPSSALEILRYRGEVIRAERFLAEQEEAWTSLRDDILANNEAKGDLHARFVQLLRIWDTRAINSELFAQIDYPSDNQTGLGVNMAKDALRRIQPQQDRIQELMKQCREELGSELKLKEQLATLSKM